MLVPPRAALQPPPPTLTMDPTLGIIVEIEPGELDGAAGSGGVDQHDDDDSARVPSSWVPVSGLGRFRDSTVAGARRTRVAIDSWMAERGLNRWHLLLLMLAAPVIVVFAIDVVSTLLGGA